MTVHEYILENWDKTIRTSKEIPYPYNVPCVNDLFVNFFYWDTYFINIGLLIDGKEKQAKNNLLVMKYFIDKIGYVPNADHLLYRSQPPVFTRGVYEFYKFTNDKNVILEFKDAILKEFEFWEKNRMTPCGLNYYHTDEPMEGIGLYYKWLDARVNYTKKEKELDYVKFTKGLLGIAESGWDFNVRFVTKDSRFASDEFAHLDLNCLLYDAEMKASEMFDIIGEHLTAEKLLKKANHRKELINKLMRDEKTGIYYDYRFVDGTLSKTLSVASLYPFAFLVSDDYKVAKATYDKLNLPYGLSTAEYRGENINYLQWDYPAMWPNFMYFTYDGFKKLGWLDLAKEIKRKYVSTVEKVFDETGHLWEKYDALTGKVSVTPEYETPRMIGWTAGVYEYFINQKD